MLAYYGVDIDQYDHLEMAGLQINNDSLSANIACYVPDLATITKGKGKRVVKENWGRSGLTSRVLINKSNTFCVALGDMITSNIKVFSKIRKAKTVMVSCLVSKNNLQKVINGLEFFGKMLIGIDQTNSWQMQLLQTPVEPYTIVNLLLKNDDKPKLFLLGWQISESLAEIVQKDLGVNKAKEIKQQLDALNKIYYMWPNDKPNASYYKQVVPLKTDLSQVQIKQALDELFEQRLTAFLTETKINTNEFTENIIGPILDLSLDAIYQDKMPTDDEINVQNKEFDELLKQILTQKG